MNSFQEMSQDQITEGIGLLVRQALEIVPAIASGRPKGEVPAVNMYDGLTAFFKDTGNSDIPHKIACGLAQDLSSQADVRLVFKDGHWFMEE